MNLHTLLPR